MPTDTKEIIAGAVINLLMKKNVKKLTVINIVEECHITRQTFYYHFEGIPDLLQWMLERGFEQLTINARAQDSEEAALRYFFLVAINAKPYINRTIDSNYGDVLQKLLYDRVYLLFEQAVEENSLYRNLNRSDLRLVLRYHCQAVMGLLLNWDDEDTKDLDHIVHVIYDLILGEITPVC